MVVKVRNTDETVINTDWAEMAVGGKVLEKVLATGEVWRVTFAIDRREMGRVGRRWGRLWRFARLGGLRCGWMCR